MKVLVTGGAGFIGSHLVDHLVADGCAVRVLDDLSTGKQENLSTHLSSSRVEFIEGDIRDAGLAAKCMQNVDAVVHLAALTSVPFSVKHPDQTFDVNVSGTQNLLWQAVKAGVGRFVLASSCAVYGDPEALPVTEDTMPAPISPYAESKLLGERLCFGFNDKQALKCAVLRFFNVYGPRQGLSEYSGVITQFFDRCRHRLPLIIYGDGLQTRDFVCVFDVVEAIVAAMKLEVAVGELFNVGSGVATSVNDLANAILDLSGCRVAVMHEASRAGDIRDSYGTIDRAKRVLGFVPRFDLRSGLQTLL